MGGCPRAQIRRENRFHLINTMISETSPKIVYVSQALLHLFGSGVQLSFYDTALFRRFPLRARGTSRIWTLLSWRKATCTLGEKRVAGRYRWALRTVDADSFLFCRPGALTHQLKPSSVVVPLLDRFIYLTQQVLVPPDPVNAAWVPKQTMPFGPAHFASGPGSVFHEPG